MSGPKRLPFPLFLVPEACLLSAAVLLLSTSRLFGAFAYEFSFSLGIAASLVFSAGTAFRLQSHARVRPLTREDLLRAPLAALFTLLAATALIVFFIGRNPTCRWDIGLTWFLLLPVVSTLFGVACGVWASHRPLGRGRALLWSLAPSAAFLLLTLRDLAMDPPVFFFHPGLGYFQGPLYDEWVPITGPLLSFRLWTLLLSAWLFSAPFVKRRTWRFLGAFILIPLLFREPLGWFHSAESIREKLGGQITGERLTLFFDTRGVSLPEAQGLSRALEFRAQQISRTLDLPRNRIPEVEVYVYGSANRKKTLTGARYTLIGNPMQKRLHLLPTEPRSTLLAHELTHVLVTGYGIPGLGLSRRIGAMEGLATAVEGYRDGLSVHEWAVAMEKLGVLPDLERVLEGGFWRESASRAYLVCGSFVRWLLDQRGPGLFLRYYRGESFEKVYGVTLDWAVSKWKAAVAHIPLSEPALRKASDDLLDPSIFERRCVHDVADELESARTCRRRRDSVGATTHTDRASDFALDPPYLLLRRASSAHLRNEEATAQALAGKVLSRPGVSRNEKTRARLLLADIDAASGRLDEAGRALRALNPGELPDLPGLSVKARLEFLEHGERDLLQTLVREGPSDTWVDRLLLSPKAPELPHAFLLAASFLWERRNSARTLLVLNRIDAARVGTFAFFRYRLEAEAAEAARQIPRALAALGEAARTARTQGERLWAQDQIDRLRAGF